MVTKKFNKRVYKLVGVILSEVSQRSSSDFPGHKQRVDHHKTRIKAHYADVIKNQSKFSFDEISAAKSFFERGISKKKEKELK